MRKRKVDKENTRFVCIKDKYYVKFDSNELCIARNREIEEKKIKNWFQCFIGCCMAFNGNQFYKSLQAVYLSAESLKHNFCSATKYFRNSLKHWNAGDSLVQWVVNLFDFKIIQQKGVFECKVAVYFYSQNEYFFLWKKDKKSFTRAFLRYMQSSFFLSFHFSFSSS